MISTLKIGELEITPPIVQGGMGVGISKANLAAAVANEGGVGVIATVGLGELEDRTEPDYIKRNEQALRDEIRKARSMTKGILGVNVMVALSNYKNLSETAVKEKVDLIISGAGFPLDLPELAIGTSIKLIPIVSSVRAFYIICRAWGKRYNKIPDAVIVEGAKAGGHLGFKYEKLLDGSAPTLDAILLEVVKAAKSYTPPIPVIAAGGIFDGSDIARVIEVGASGVQMATRFVCTDECDVHQDFKQVYLDAEEKDITIIKSPVGLPGRVINNAFVESIKRGETIPRKCTYKCLKPCDPKTAPYCIAKVLLDASKGDFEKAFAFAGSNAYRCDEIISVKQLIANLKREMLESS